MEPSRPGTTTWIALSVTTDVNIHHANIAANARPAFVEAVAI